MTDSSRGAFTRGMVTPMQRKEPKTLADVLARALRHANLKSKIDEQAVGPVWSQAVGPRIAANTTPQVLRGGTLVVHARSGTWVSELSMLSDEIRLRLNRTLGRGVVAELKFVIGPISAGPVPLIRTVPEPTDDDRREVKADAAPIADDELRAQVERTMLRARAARRKR